MKNGWIYGLILLFLFSCRNQKEAKILQHKDPANYLQLVNWEHFNEYDWNNMSFPNWFIPGIVDSFNITALQLQFINYVATDSLSNREDTLPTKKLIFDFNSNGNVKKIVANDYNDGLKIIEQTFRYSHAPDTFGYTAPTILSDLKYKDNRLMPFLSTVQALRQYHRLVKVKQDSSFVDYVDENNPTKMHHVFILDSSHWNATYINNHFRPTSNSIFYYGNPKRFVSAFLLKNMVEKTNLVQQSFYSNGTLKRQWFNEKGFVTIRNFSYDSIGLCTGYTDSLKTNLGEFLRLEEGKITYAANRLPNTLRIYDVGDSLTLLRGITFNYETKKE